MEYVIIGEGKVLSFYCSRISSLSEDEERYRLAGKDPSTLYEEYESLDIDDAIIKYKSDLLTFDLLDSFSSPHSYGFYYMGTDDYEPYSEIGYNYKNYGSFVDEDGIIQISLVILDFEDTDREDFFTLCETVTNSIRFSGTKAGGAQDADPVPDNAYEEICWVSETNPDTYYAAITEIRRYEGLEAHEFAHTFTLSKSSSGDHYISEIESDDRGAAEYEELPVYDEALPGEAGALPLDLGAYTKRYTHLDAPELRYTYGTNSQIPEQVFVTVINYITSGDSIWAEEEFLKATYESRGVYDYEMYLDSAVDQYKNAYEFLAGNPAYTGYSETPVYKYASNLWLFGPLWDSARTLVP